MRRRAKVWIGTAAVLVVVGCVIFGGVMTVLKWDFSKLSTVQYETQTHIIEEEFNAISIFTDTADIAFVHAEDGKCSVVCHEPQNTMHSVVVRDNTLVIEIVDSRKWYEHIGINFSTPQITVYLPKMQYASLAVKESTGDIEVPEGFQFESAELVLSTGDVNFVASASELLKIKTNTGRIYVANAAAGDMDLTASTGRITVSNVNCRGDAAISVTTGKVYLTDVTCRNFTSSGNTGDIILTNVVVAEKLLVKRTTGEVKFDGCDAAEVLVETSTGSVKGTFLSEKVFLAESNTGRVDVPESVTGGRCEIKTSIGNIELEIK